MEVTGTHDAFQRARKLRREMTKPERLLWWALNADKTGFHFASSMLPALMYWTSTATARVFAWKWTDRRMS